MASSDRLSFDTVELDKYSDKLIEWGSNIEGIPLTTSWRNIEASIPAEGIEGKYFLLKYSNGKSDPVLTIKRTGLYYFNIYNARFRLGNSVDTGQIAWTAIIKENAPDAIDQVANYLYWPGAIVAMSFKNEGILHLSAGTKLRAMYSKSGIDNYNIYGGGVITCQFVHIRDIADN